MGILVSPLLPKDRASVISAGDWLFLGIICSQTLTPQGQAWTSCLHLLTRIGCHGTLVEDDIAGCEHRSWIRPSGRNAPLPPPCKARAGPCSEHLSPFTPVGYEASKDKYAQSVCGEGKHPRGQARL